MTTIELASSVFKVIRENRFTDQNVSDLNKIIQKLNRIESHVYENGILPKFVEALNRIGPLNRDEARSKNVITCISMFTSKTFITNEIAFKTMAIILLDKVYDPQKNIMHNISEELLISVFNCFEVLCRRLEGGTIEQLYVKKHATVLGQIIYVAIENIQKDQDTELRISAINCLMSVFQVHNEFDKEDVVLRNQIADILFIMTPRIFGVLSKLIESDKRTPSKLKAKALQGINRILCLIFEDKTPVNDSSNLTSDDFLTLVNSKSNVVEMKSNGLKSIEDKKKYMESAERNEEWIRLAISKLNPFLNRLPTLLLPDYGPNVHKELLKMSQSIMKKCSITFQNEITVFFEIILIMESENTEILQEMIQQLEEHPNSKRILRDGFYRHLLRFSRCVHRKSESQLLIALKLLNGYLKYFLHRDSNILTNSDNSELIFQNLALIFELNYPLMLQEETLEWNHMSLNLNFKNLPWKQLKFIQESDLHEALDQVLVTLQHESIFSFIVNKIFDQITFDSNSSNELMCLLIKILENFNQNETHEPQLIDLILTEFLEDRHWYLPFKNDSTTNDRKISLDEINFNIIHICLVIELLGTCSSHIKSNRDQFLFNVIPKILEKAGLNNVIIHTAALYGLELISMGLKFENVNALIENQSDFISHFIEIRLKKDDIKNCLDMTNAFLELCSSYDELLFVQSLFETMMSLFNRPVSVESHSAALKITLILLKKVHSDKMKLNSDIKPNENVNKLNANELFEKWMQILEPPEVLRPDPNDAPLDFDQIKEEMLKLKNDKELNEAPEDENAENTPEETQENKFIRNLIRSMIGFISSSNAIHKMYAIDIVSYCLQLQDIENKEFLPTIHLIWNPISTRFKESNLLVISRTFDLLLVIARLSKDFIQKRASNEVLPLILEFMKKSALDNLENTGSFASSLTQNFKLQEKIFENIGEIFQYLDVHESMLDQLLEACSSFLMSNQQKIVKKSCLNLLKKLFLYDSTAVIVKFYHVKL
uniref:CSON005528 protein n=1 Tax=Culicoides sonorensis TaxID=179676 RepID=A0A336LYQ5_CULSO